MLNKGILQLLLMLVKHEREALKVDKANRANGCSNKAPRHLCSDAIRHKDGTRILNL
jgi:hypothetical protein